MICEIFPLRPRADGAHPTVAYVFGATKAKRGRSSSDFQYLTDSGIGLADIGTDNRIYTSEELHSSMVDTCASMLDFQSELNRRVRKPIWHATLSLSHEEISRLSNEQWSEIAHKFMDGMEFKDNRWVAVLHKDSDNPHIHLVASTVTDLPGNPVTARYKDYRKAESLMREIEVDYGLQETPSSNHGKTVNHPHRQTKKHDIRQLIDQALSDCLENSQPTLDKLKLHLEEKGLTCRVQYNDNQPTGISYSAPGGFIAAGSKLGARGRYTTKGLQSQGILLTHNESHPNYQANPTTNYSLLQPPLKVPNTEGTAYRISFSLERRHYLKLRKHNMVRRPDRIERTGNKLTINYGLRHNQESVMILNASVNEAILESIRRAVDFILELIGFEGNLSSATATSHIYTGSRSSIHCQSGIAPMTDCRSLVLTPKGMELITTPKSKASISPGTKDLCSTSSIINEPSI